MSITYLPDKMLRNVAAKALIKRLINDDFSLNKVALTTISRTGVISKASLEDTARGVISEYKSRYKELLEDGLGTAVARAQTLNQRKQMINRVQNLIVMKVSEDITEKYYGSYYIWLPSDAEEPDPLHQLKYGKRFRIGYGEMPGQRYGCKCGMRILVKGTSLEL